MLSRTPLAKLPQLYRKMLLLCQSIITLSSKDADKSRAYFSFSIFFLQKVGDKCQIVNLGCGFDTLFFRLCDAGHVVTRFIEIDFPTVTSRKCYQIKRNKSLLQKIHSEDGEVRLSPTDLHSAKYHIVGVDLRNIDEVASKMQQSEIDFTMPTIFLAECVLVYIEPQNSSNLLSYIAANFKTAVFVNYEQVRIGVTSGMTSDK